MTRAAMLEVRDVTVRFGARRILDSVGFDASGGEIVAVIGPNGAGKTTLLEVVAGLCIPECGTVQLQGAALGALRDRARSFAFLADDVELPAELRIREVVAHALSFRPRQPAVVEHLRRQLGIDALSDAPAGVLSRGERSRVALFTALSIERPVVLLDEPFSAFDPLMLREVLVAVRDLARSGVAIVATVHHLSDAARVASRVLLLAEGRVVAFGDLAALQRKAEMPGGTLEDLFVALLSRRRGVA